MPRRDDDNVIPFRRPRRRKWTRPEDFLPLPPPPPRDWGDTKRRAAAWLVIAVVVAATVAGSLLL